MAVAVWVCEWVWKWLCWCVSTCDNGCMGLCVGVCGFVWVCEWRCEWMLCVLVTRSHRGEDVYIGGRMDCVEVGLVEGARSRGWSVFVW